MSEYQTVLITLFILAIIGGATAAIAGFGIGSLLTPFVLAVSGATTAVAIVAIPHAVATALRCWRLRRSIDWPVVRSFGLLSAAGGLAGAALFARLSDTAITRALGALLVATAIAGLSGWTSKVAPNRAVSGALGVASGVFGGLAGNQGGLRAAALMLYRLAPAAFVATSTATGLLVDAARMPVYVVRSWTDIAHSTLPIAVMTAGVVIGTLVGERALFGLDPKRFRLLVSALIGILGAWMLTK